MKDSEGFLSDEDDDEVEEEGMIDVERVDSSPDAASGDLVRPVTDNFDEIRKSFEQFEDLKDELLDSSDIQTAGGNPFITKSGWRKIAAAFNVSVETVEESRYENDGVVSWKVKAMATAPNGKTASGVGMASSNESNFMEASKPDDGKPEDHKDYLMVDGKWRRLKAPREVNKHNMFTTAATRAKNRAISDLVGGGEVSAEEMEADDFF